MPPFYYLTQNKKFLGHNNIFLSVVYNIKLITYYSYAQTVNSKISLSFFSYSCIFNQATCGMSNWFVCLIVSTGPAESAKDVWVSPVQQQQYIQGLAALQIHFT